MAWGFAPPLILEAAIRNKVFDVLDSGPKTLEDLAATTKTSPRGLRAIVNALVGFNLLCRTGECYGLTNESAAFLVATKPSFQGGIYRHISTQIIPAWLDLARIVRVGKADRAVNQEGAGRVLRSIRGRHPADELQGGAGAGRHTGRSIETRRWIRHRQGARHCLGFRSVGDRLGPEVGRGSRHRGGLAQGHADHAGDRRSVRCWRPVPHGGRRPARG